MKAKFLNLLCRAGLHSWAFRFRLTTSRAAVYRCRRCGRGIVRFDL